MAETSVAAAEPRIASAGKSDSTLISRIAFVILAIFLIGVVLAYAVFYFGSVRGEEFAPETFTRRRFAYLELPLLRIQISPIRHTDSTNDLERYLTAQKLVPGTKRVSEPRWDLVVASLGVKRGTYGDARILSQYLDATNQDGDNIWLKWSEDNVELAKVFWSAIAKVARQELYSFVPDLFVLARSASSADRLQQEIDATLADKYRLAAETFESLDEQDLAEELYAEASRHASNQKDTAVTKPGVDESGQSNVDES